MNTHKISKYPLDNRERLAIMPALFQGMREERFEMFCDSFVILKIWSKEGKGTLRLKAPPNLQLAKCPVRLEA
jgi:hypothetical protein